MKVESPDIPHKTEAGGVRLGVADRDGVRDAFAAIMANARAHAPNADLRGVLVQQMAGRGVEAFVGLVRHPPFGLGMVVGVGGVLVELVADTAFDLLPLDPAGANALIDGTRLGKLLAGYRGQPAADREALVSVLLKLSDFATRYRHLVDAVDLNPVIVFADGHGAMILDALVVSRQKSSTTV